MESEITYNGALIGTVTWDPEVPLFYFDVPRDSEIYPLLASIQFKGEMTILVSLPGADEITQYPQTLRITNSKFLGQLSWEIGRLGYDL